MKQKLAKYLSILFIIFLASIALFPFVITILNSFFNPADAEGTVTELIQKGRLSLEAYQVFFSNPIYMRMVGNSILLVVPILLGQLFIAPAAAYGFECLQWRGKEVLFFLYLLFMLMPMQVLLVPHFIVAGWLGIRDSYLAIILPAVFHPLGVFIIRQQIKNFPVECLEAARIDGASESMIYRKIVCPNIVATVVAVLILLFTDNWNIIDQAVVFIRSMEWEPMSVYLSAIWENDTKNFFAISVIYALPTVLLLIVGQSYLVKGIQLSGVKN